MTVLREFAGGIFLGLSVLVLMRVQLMRARAALRDFRDAPALGRKPW